MWIYVKAPLAAYSLLWLGVFIRMLFWDYDPDGIHFLPLLVLGFPTSAFIGNLGGESDEATLWWLGASCLLNTLVGSALARYGQKKWPN